MAAVPVVEAVAAAILPTLVRVAVAVVLIMAVPPQAARQVRILEVQQPEMMEALATCSFVARVAGAAHKMALRT